MSDFAPPPFNADNALVTIKRALRDMKLAERGNAYEMRGKRVVELSIEPPTTLQAGPPEGERAPWERPGGAHDGATISAKLARRLMLTPEWDRMAVKSAADQRKLLDEVKKRLGKWESDE